MSKRLPSEKAALELLKQTGCSKKVVEHCKIVADFAAEVAETCRTEGLKVDVSLVRIGALLHDIGRSKTHDFDHGLVGAQIARNLSLPASLVSIIERHVGTGITQNEAEQLGWPTKSYIPKSLEERIVAYTDKLIRGSTRMPFNTALERFRRDKNTAKDAVERLRQWHQEFSHC